jgi:thioredoxin reductase (NADPH)
VPGETELTGRGVSYCGTCDGFFFRGKKIVVVGGGDSAIKESLFLTKFASHLDIIHRRDSLRAEAALQNRALANEKISFIWNTVVEEIKGANGKVESVVLRDVKTGEVRDYPTEGVFVFVGHEPNNALFKDTLAMDAHGYVLTDKHMQTNVEGVFAAGEIQDPLWKQVASSVGQGCAAAIAAEEWLAQRETSPAQTPA